MDGKRQRQRRPARGREVVDRRGTRMRGLAGLAERQHGNVTRSQLVDLGFSTDQIDRLVTEGWLRRMHRAVYFVGHGEISHRARAMAAVLAVDAGAFVSHRSAACLYGFLPYSSPPDDVHVTVANRALAARSGISLHRSATLSPADTRELDGIPITSPARTLLGIAATAPGDLDEAFDEAVFRRDVRMHQLRELLGRASGQRGAPALRALVQAESAGRRNRLAAEKRFARLIRDAGLPLPGANASVGRFKVDFLWPEHRVVVELDGFATHGRRRSFESDRARDGDLQARGYRVLRVTWRQLTQGPQAVVARVAGVLALAAADRAATDER